MDTVKLEDSRGAILELTTDQLEYLLTYAESCFNIIDKNKPMYKEFMYPFYSAIYPKSALFWKQHEAYIQEQEDKKRIKCNALRKSVRHCKR